MRVGVSLKEMNVSLYNVPTSDEKKGMCVGVCSGGYLRECVCREGECADCSALVLGMPIRSGYKS